MRVAFLTTSFPRFPADYAGVFVYDLARALARRGINIDVLAPHTVGAARYEGLGGVRVHRFPYFYPAQLQRVAYGAGIPTNLRIDRLARLQLLPFVASFFWHAVQLSRSADLIHAHWIEPGLLGFLCSRILKRPLVLSVHRYNPLGLLGRRVYQIALGGSDCVFFNSNYTRCRAEADISVHFSKVVPPGIDLERFPPSWEVAPAEDKPNHTVFALGSLLPVKGFIHLIEAMPSVLEAVPNCRFFIGGQGPERERLVQRAVSLGVQDRLTLLGRVNTTDVPRLMRSATVFVLPSIPHAGDSETLGMVLVEALASGTPCVASRTGGITDVVKDGVNGFLVPPGEPLDLAKSIRHLLASPGLRQQMARAGRAIVEEKFSLEAISKQVQSVYREISERS